MFDMMTTTSNLSHWTTRFYIMQLIEVLEHLHSNRIIYRDLKPENVMIGKSGYITLVDMGTAKRLSLEKRFKTSTIIGTPHYMAPEIIIGKGYTFPADLWSLGVMMYELVIGKLPYGSSSDDPFQIYE